MTPLFLGLSLAVGAPQAKDRPKAEQSLVGQWAVESATIGATPSPKHPGLQYAFTPGGECVVSVAPGVPPSRAKFTADAKADPPTFTLVNEGSATVTVGIYKVEGDTLTLCWDSGPDTARPKKFESSAGSKIVLYVLKRVKAKE